VIGRNSTTVLIAAVLVALLSLALVLAHAQHKLPLLALDLTEHLFGIVLAVFVLERALAWREERRWFAAKNWLYMILLESIDDLLQRLLPATVPRTTEGFEEEITVYEVSGERARFGEAVAHSKLRLLVSPVDEDLQSHLSWYAMELGPLRYADLAKKVLAETQDQIRDMFGSSARLMEADITAMLMSLEQSTSAAMRHLESAASMREEKSRAASMRDVGAPAERRTTEVDRELAFACGIIVESVIASAIKPKAWLEDRLKPGGYLRG
jgi:hypothetical protein